MREVKFRAWDKENNRIEEIDGGNLYIADNRVYEMYAGSFGMGCTFEKNNVTERYELMQFTGLHDKNGTPIYEGDIIKDARGSLFLVYWDESECAFKLDYKYYHDKDKDECHTYLPVYSRKGEVIGNTCENPELLRS